ncbi:MAG TPA: alanine racemase, partial [Nitrospiria bacterium]|nr:alanine racemase [Nitrospiria bacterium]
MTHATPALRPTVARVDLGAIRFNVGQARTLAGGRHLIAVVKADAYGHGAAAVARAIEADGVRRFGVALVEEGRVLREAGVRGDIIVLGGFAPEQARDVV